VKLPSLFTRNPQPTEPERTTAGPEPIRLILADRDLIGWIEPGEERVSDLLQRGRPLSFLPGGPTSSSWLSVDPAELLVVVPPPHVSPPERRLQRQRHEVMIRIGGWMVGGTAHLMPGEEYDPYLRSTRQFLPLTDATLGKEGDESPSAFETLIVNLKRVDEFRVV
jgi:hypothetical protein